MGRILLLNTALSEHENLLSEQFFKIRQMFTLGW